MLHTYTGAMVDSAHCHSAAAVALNSSSAALPDWLVPDWPAPAHVRALCTARAGGVSLGAYASMNLGSHVGDDPAAVAENRARLMAALVSRGDAAQTRPVFLEQVHGSTCEALVPQSAEAQQGMACDAAVATQPGVACTIMVADCLPVLITDSQGRAVAAAHAGWRGLAGGVLESTLKRFEALAPMQKGLVAHLSIANDEMTAITPTTATTDWLVWLGPCIGQQAFEVGEAVRDAFCSEHPAAAGHFIHKGPGKYLANLAGLARQRLSAAGVAQVFGNDGSAQWCTVTNASQFFSHRRDGHAIAGGGVGGTGRMAACIWLV